jgi:hypothetical protein
MKKSDTKPPLDLQAFVKKLQKNLFSQKLFFATLS